MLPVISEVATHKKHSSKNLQISQKIRSSHRKCSVKIGVFKSFTNFAVKRLWEALFNTVTNLWPATLLKRDPSTGVFL